MSETKLPTREKIARQIDPDAFEGREKASFWGAEAIINGRIEKALKSADVILAYFTPSPKHMSTPSTQAPASVDEPAKNRQIAELEAEIERLKDRLGDPDGTIAHADVLTSMAEKATARATAAESALRSSREIADGLAGALREIRDRDWIENCLDTQWSAGAARQALLAYDVARKGDGGERA